MIYRKEFDITQYDTNHIFFTCRVKNCFLFIGFFGSNKHNFFDILQNQIQGSLKDGELEKNASKSLQKEKEKSAKSKIISLRFGLIRIINRRQSNQSKWISERQKTSKSCNQKY